MKEELKKELRRLLEETTEVTTKFYTIADMKVTMSDYTVNPYRVMFNMATKTWGNFTDKWSLASPELRFEVVKMILQRKALPLALEHPKFSFQVDHISRAAFDQLARARIGIVFASKGQKDDNLHNIGFVIPMNLYKSIGGDIEVKSIFNQTKRLYDSLIEAGFPNWSARCILPMYTEHSFIFSANFLAIQNMLGKRLETTEMEDVIAFSLLVRREIEKRFPLLAEYLRPASDWSGKDMTAAFNGFSDIIGVPHISDNRHPGYNKELKAKWNEPCTNIKEVEKAIGIKLPEPNGWGIYTWETLAEQDRTLFEDGKSR